MTEQDRATADEDKAKYEAMIAEGLDKVFKQGFDMAYAPIQKTLDALGYGHRHACDVLRELEATRLKSAQMIGEMMLERDAAIAAARAEGRAEVEPFLAGLVESLGGEIFFPRNAEARTVEIDEDGEMIAVRSLE